MNTLEEAQKIWSSVNRDQNIRDKSFDFAKQKKLLDFFHVGAYYCYIFNVRKAFIEFISDDVAAVLGHSKAEIDLEFLIELMHPDDKPYFLNFEVAVERFFAERSGSSLFNYKAQYDFRLKRADGNYVRILHQYVIVRHDENDVLTFAVDTDITHIKPNGEPQLSLIGINGAESYFNVDTDKVFTPGKSVFTKREQEIIKELAAGKNSQEISDRLHISKYTVDVHRKNLLKKTGAKSTYEILNKAFINGWV